jgi:hypothetical protein
MAYTCTVTLQQAEMAATIFRALALNQFHTYRFESTDGSSFSVSVDGFVFMEGTDNSPSPPDYIGILGDGGCISDQIPNMENAWDFVRYGTIAYGEQIVSSEPPGGFLDARIHAPLDRFTVTYDAPNYVQFDEIAVNVQGIEGAASYELQVTSYEGGGAPVVTATGRRDNSPPDEVEIVLDRPIPFNATTTFTFDDGVAVNVVEYTFAPGDTDGDGDADLADYAWLQNCGGSYGLRGPSHEGNSAALNTGPCLVLDGDDDSAITPADSAGFTVIMSGPQ